MPYVIGAAVDDILLMQKGERYFLECETGEQTSWDLCIVMAPADKRHDESLQQVNCNFVEADGTTRADTARLHKILVHKWSPHVLQVVPPFWIRYMVDLRGDGQLRLCRRRRCLVHLFAIALHKSTLHSRAVATGLVPTVSRSGHTLTPIVCCRWCLAPLRARRAGCRLRHQSSYRWGSNPTTECLESRSRSTMARR
jgi:hypothetical protein